METVFLLEFLILDVISMAARPTMLKPPNAEAFAVDGAVIGIGDRRITIEPSVTDAPLTRVTLVMGNPAHDETAMFACDLLDSRPRWTTTRPESGLRRVLEPYLPARSVEVDESLFRALLNRCLVGPQPLFTMTGTDVRQGLGHLLDFVTSDDLRRSLSLGVRASASHVARQVALAAPAVRTSALKALPRPPRRNQPASDGAAGDEGSGRQVEVSGL